MGIPSSQVRNNPNKFPRALGWREQSVLGPSLSGGAARWSRTWRCCASTPQPQGGLRRRSTERPPEGGRPHTLALAHGPASRPGWPSPARHPSRPRLCDRRLPDPRPLPSGPVPAELLGSPSPRGSRPRAARGRRPVRGGVVLAVDDPGRHAECSRSRSCTSWVSLNSHGPNGCAAS